MNPLTQFKKIRVLPVAIALVLVLGRAYAIDLSPDPVIRWSNEARKAIVPPSAGPENYGRRGPSDAAVYMGIAHSTTADWILCKPRACWRWRMCPGATP